ncbi:MAG: hypothetical protein M1820_003607 [Bogoriella megaspora]|nr:MAG: hypothetical protein M1820_003607 [Bogoriella megaspora]
MANLKRKTELDLDNEAFDRKRPRRSSYELKVQGRSRPMKHNANRGKELHGDYKRVHIWSTENPTGQSVFYEPEDDSVHEPVESDSAFAESFQDVDSYLRTVRSQARGVPDIVTTRQPSQEEESDHRGWYSDGAYIARPVIGPQLPQNRVLKQSPSLSRSRRRNTSSVSSAASNRDEPSQPVLASSAFQPEPSSAQSLYHARLLQSFHAHRAFLQQKPPASAVTRLTYQQPTVLHSHFGPYGVFKTTILSKSPPPAQLASMDTQTVLEVINMAKWALKPRRNVKECTSAWIWGLLARLDNVGLLSTDEIGVVRELGKRAIWIRSGFEGINLEALEERREADEAEFGSDYQVEEWLGNDGDMDHEEESAMELSEEEGDTWEGLETEPGNPGEIDLDMEDASSTNTSEVEMTAAGTGDPKLEHEKMKGGKEGKINLEREPEAEGEMRDEIQDKGTEMEEDDPAMVEAARQRIKAMIDTLPDAANTPSSKNGGVEEEVPDANTLVTLEMIITIVGEVYGQRDLLEFRKVWN